MMISSKNRKKTLTLVEVLLVMSLLAIASGMIGWSVKKYFEKNQFVSEWKRIESLIRMGRTNAILSESDWELHLISQKGALQLSWVCPQDPEAKSFLSRTGLSKGVQVLSKSTQNPIHTITFYSSGWVDPLETICIVKEEHKKELVLSEILALSINNAPSVEEILEKS